MERICVFKCQFNGRRFRIIAVGDTYAKGLRSYYAYEGRKRLDRYPWSSLGGAVGRILKELSWDITDKIAEVWS